MTLIPIKKILDSTLHNLKIDSSRKDIYDIWDREMGRFAEHAQIVSVRDDFIIVNVDNSVFLQELVLRKKEILKKINLFLKKKPIKDMKFRAGNIK